VKKQRGIKNVDRHRFIDYQKVAVHFYQAAKDSLDLEYWTASGVLIIHSAIAFADAICIKLVGQRSASEDHEEAIALLNKTITESEEKNKALNQLRRLIEEKTKVSYLGGCIQPYKQKRFLKD
jgi:ADP-ribosylglycohydrolase